MSRYVYEGYTRVAWVPGTSGIADVDAPSTVELNGGTDLSQLLTKDGLQTPTNQNNVDSSTLAETFDAEIAGSWGGGGLTLTCFRDNASDTAWDLFAHGVNGFVVIRRGVAYDTAWANGQDCEVWPFQSHEPVMNQSARNEEQRFTVQGAVTSEPSQHSVVGGGS